MEAKTPKLDGMSICIKDKVLIHYNEVKKENEQRMYDAH